ncbi:hypothetical protein Calag_1220 [Caldisphaera lagunensis DSM 15908]|uniref:Uncharacterized protein n=1 Tax=Caldisphaera lagunensis (strain DSM 15908 / JCM 11604 / ANMR 0165 / IC-154) TaxID=1056495 RepID=L0ABY0_CALLD|nr:hypothetical protein [Caldisphaera lagunensis]AFZ70939.1 hypothetical protein Calag_1220 [Caldisphaera lagunensis DSM 15908]
MDKICSICKKRQAIYYRAYSGEYICAKCLNNVMEKNVKKEINKTKSLSIDSKIVIPITYFSPSSSIALSNLIYRIEKRYKSRIAIVIPKDYNIEEIKNFLENKSDLFIAEINIKPPERLSLQECIRFERVWSMRAAKILGYEFVFLPVSRTDISLIVIDSLINGKANLLSESLEFIEYNGIKFLYPFSGIEGETLVSYEFLSGINVKPLCLTNIKSKNVFYSIAGNRPELDFGSERLLDKLGNFLDKLGKCKICAGFSDKEICDTCNKLNLKELDVKLSFAQ